MDGTFNAARQQRSGDRGHRARGSPVPRQPARRAPGRHRPLDPRASRQVQLLRGRGRGGLAVGIAGRRTRRPRGRIGRHRHGGRRPAPDHERVDDRSGGDPGDVRGGDPGQHAPVLDLAGPLRGDRAAPAPRAPRRRRLHARGRVPPAPRSGPHPPPPASRARTCAAGSTIGPASAAANGPTWARAGWCATGATTSTGP